MRYRRRIVDDLLDDLFPDLAALAQEGAKGVGKTASAGERATSVLALDDPAQRQSVTADLDLVARLEAPVLIDEWQLVPAVWDRIRRAVDRNSSGGQYLLTGSAGVTPEAPGALGSGTDRPPADASPGLQRASDRGVHHLARESARRGRAGHRRHVVPAVARLCRRDPAFGLPRCP
ncbi:MAG: hypothetical protein ACRCY8_13240 [Dermatophilaceae bacterium]